MYDEIPFGTRIRFHNLPSMKYEYRGQYARTITYLDIHSNTIRVQLESTGMFLNVFTSRFAIVHEPSCLCHPEHEMKDSCLDCMSIKYP